MERTLRSSGRHPLRVLKVRPPSPAKANPSVEGDSMASKRVATARGRQLSSEARREEMSVIFSSLLQNNNNQKVSTLFDPYLLGHATVTELNFGLVSQFNTKMNRD